MPVRQLNQIHRTQFRMQAFDVPLPRILFGTSIEKDGVFDISLGGGLNLVSPQLIYLRDTHHEDGQSMS